MDDNIGGLQAGKCEKTRHSPRLLQSSGRRALLPAAIYKFGQAWKTRKARLTRRVTPIIKARIAVGYQKISSFPGNCNG
jgi:hypothetical protein